MQDGVVRERRIAVIGGGSGVRVLIAGLTRHMVYPIGICSVFDSGGSTGRLLGEFGEMLPSGDLRNVFEALIPPKNEFARELFALRLNGNGKELSGHSLGNLVLLGAQQVAGDPIAGLYQLGKLFDIHGEVWPVSVDKTDLEAVLSDGSVVTGEDRIDARSDDRGDNRTIRAVRLKRQVFVARQTARALLSADVIVLGPGDLYTSIIPNLLVSGMIDLLNTAKAKLVFVCNLMTKWGETNHYTVTDFVETFYKYGLNRKFDVLVVNNVAPPDEVRENYRKDSAAVPVDVSPETLSCVENRVGRVLADNFLSQDGLRHGLVRHDSTELARAVVGL